MANSKPERLDDDPEVDIEGTIDDAKQDTEPCKYNYPKPFL